MILKNFFRLFKTNLIQTIATVLLLSFLVFFLNIFIALTANVYSFSKEIKWKLWVHIYFKEWETKDDVDHNYNLIIDMKDRLTHSWLKVLYLSKEQATKNFFKRTFDSNTIRNFKRFDIKNPIPATLYINFNSEKQYQTMKKIVLDKKYQDIISDLSDIWTVSSFREQEDRISKIIEFSNFSIKFYIFLSFILLLIIVWLLTLILKINFYWFYNQIEVEKLIWFSFFQIKAPFLFYTIFLILFSFVFSLLYVAILVSNLNMYFQKVFDFNLMNLITDNLHYIKIWLWVEILFLIWVTLLVWNVFLNRLIKKI